MARQLKSINNYKDRQRKLDFEIRKSRHRCADTKYRSKVQFFYGKLSQMLRKKSAKDSLLNNTLSCILKLEDEICETIGFDNMDPFKKQFLSFLSVEETLWKKEKDVSKWWSNIEVFINKELLCDKSFKDDHEPDTIGTDHNRFPGINSCISNATCLIESQRKCKHSSFSRVETCIRDEKQYAGGLKALNELISGKHLNYMHKDTEYKPNNLWNLPHSKADSSLCETSPDSFIPFGEISNNTSLGDEQNYFTLEAPFEIPGPPIPVDPALLEGMEYSSSTFLYM